MSDQSSVICEFNSRLTEFQEAYLWHEPDGLVRALRLTGELVELAFDPVTAARAMQSLRLVVATPPDTPISWASLPAEPLMDWNGTWEDLDAFNDTSWSELMEAAQNLNAFAYFSIMPSWALAHVDRTTAEFGDLPSYIRSVVTRLNSFMQLLPKSMELYGIENIERTCMAASARLKIDLNEQLTVHELAAATQVTAKRLQNAIYAKSADAPLVGKDGLIQALSAQRWLEARDYRPSIWKEFIAAKGWEAAGPVLATEPDEVDDFMFAPEARDGSLFSPIACRRVGRDGVSRYTIGANGSDVDFEDFEEALAELLKMKTPRWRRPNENGNFGIVSAERWRRVTRRELFSM